MDGDTGHQDSQWVPRGSLQLGGFSAGGIFARVPVLMLLTAACYEDFREPIVRFLRQWQQVLVIGTDRAAADEWARAACDRALLGIHRMTLPQLAAALSERAMASQGLVAGKIG